MRLDLPVVASNDVHMHVAQRKPLQDVLTAIRLKTSVEELGTAVLDEDRVICEAVQRPNMRFVPVKTADQQAAVLLHRGRERLVRQRTMLANALRAHPGLPHRRSSIWNGRSRSRSRPRTRTSLRSLNVWAGCPA